MLNVDRLPLGGSLFAAILLSGLIFQKTGLGKRSYLVYAFLMLVGLALYKGLPIYYGIFIY